MQYILSLIILTAICIIMISKIKNKPVAYVLCAGLLARGLIAILTATGIELGRYGSDPDFFGDHAIILLESSQGFFKAFSQIQLGLNHRIYVAFIWMIYKIFGVNELYLYVLNAVVDIIALYFVYKIYLIVWRDLKINRIYIILFLAIITFWPTRLYFSSAFVYRDSLIALSLSSSVYFIIMLYEKRSYKYILYLIPMLTALALLRPQWFVILVFSCILAIILFHKFKNFNIFKKASLFASLLLSPMILSFIPSMGRISYKYLDPSRIASIKNNLTRGENTAISEVVFNTWFDVLLYIPKGFYEAIMMPLPLLYDINSMTLLLASIENIVLLFTLILIILNIFHKNHKRTADGFIILITLLMIIYTSIFAPDLGSVTRQKYLFLHFLFIYIIDIKTGFPLSKLPLFKKLIVYGNIPDREDNDIA